MSTKTTLLLKQQWTKNKEPTCFSLISVSLSINHGVLIRRSCLRYGCAGKTLDWVISYLQGRTQRVVIGDQSYNTSTLTSRQVSHKALVLGRCFFRYTYNLSMTSYESIVYSSINIPTIYVNLDLNNSALVIAIKQMHSLTKVVWFVLVWLKLIGTLTWQVSQTISARSFYLRNITQLSRFRHRPTKERVVNAIIASRFDYCNALSYTARLQLTSPICREHTIRLPGWFCVPTGCPMCTYNSCTTMPMYLCELVCPYQRTKALTKTLSAASSDVLEMKRICRCCVPVKPFTNSY